MPHSHIPPAFTGGSSFNLPHSISISGYCYRPGCFLGRGSSGQVFRLEDLKYNLSRLAATKLLPQEFSGGPGLLKDIEHAASALARLSHPNILQDLDFKVSAEQPFIVTTLAEGDPVANRLRLKPAQPPVRPPFDTVRRYLEPIAGALDEADCNLIQIQSRR